MVYDAIESSFNDSTIVNVLHPFDHGEKKKWYFKKGTPFSFLMRRLHIRKLTIRYIREGNDVFSGLNCGSINYIQPPVEQRRASLKQKLSQSYYSWVESFVNRSKLVLELAIYNSEFTRKQYHVESKREAVLFPPLMRDYGFEPSQREDMVLCISRIDFNKNLEAVGRLSEVLDYKVVLAGYVPHGMESYLEQLGNQYPRMQILTNISEDEKAGLLRRSKVLVMPSVGEPFGMVKLEAMVAGTVPVVHNSGGAPEGIPPGLSFMEFDELVSIVNKYVKEYDPGYGMELRNISLRYTLDAFQEKFQELLSGLPGTK